MKAYKKALALFLALGLSLSLASCSQIQAAIGSITGQEDPSVAGNKPAGNHDDEDTWTPPSSTPAPVEHEIDEQVEPFEMDGITIPKYKNEGYTVIDLGGGVHSDIHDIAIIDANGTELMSFPSDKLFGEYAHNFISDEWIDSLKTPDPDISLYGSYGIKVNDYYSGIGDSWGPLIEFRNIPKDVSLLDLKCDSIENLMGNALPIIAERLGTPTSLVATWDSMTSSYISQIHCIWICDGFYVEGYVDVNSLHRGDYKTLSIMAFHLCSGDPDRDYVTGAFKLTKAELGLA